MLHRHIFFLMWNSVYLIMQSWARRDSWISLNPAREREIKILKLFFLIENYDELLGHTYIGYRQTYKKTIIIRITICTCLITYKTISNSWWKPLFQIPAQQKSMSGYLKRTKKSRACRTIFPLYQTCRRFLISGAKHRQKHCCITIENRGIKKRKCKSIEIKSHNGC